MQSEDLLNDTTSMEGDGEGLPVLPFLPPTEEPSSATLAISVTLVGCLTIAICGNVPLCLPSVILEKLVRIWMFGRLSCHAHHILTTAGRVLIPWTIAALHMFVALFLSRPNRLTRFEGLLASLAFSFLTLLVLVVVIPQGLAAQLEVIRKDEIDSDQYIMLIHTYRCYLKPDLYPVTQIAKFAFEFAVPLLLSCYFQFLITSRAKLKSSKAVSRNLICILIIHYFCNILHYIPEAKRDMLFLALPEDADLLQLLPFLSPTLIWYPLSQLSAKLSRCNSDKIEDELSRSRVLGRRATESERSRLMAQNF
ncbi:hypothetical protein GCK32_006765 [Trichostrongylus colubriformis]|uniref:G protein-coupled receptor n=1 Tax=Trichostrongylus colubriformis TaxID=6319 RepID=A0AAN8IXT1_TRICO